MIKGIAIILYFVVFLVFICSIMQTQYKKGNISVEKRDSVFLFSILVFLYPFITTYGNGFLPTNLINSMKDLQMEFLLFSFALLLASVVFTMHNNSSSEETT